ncbi:MAG: hypothetical protein GY870_07950, partial [archaeon]|nr:hypothetical protein [archaeon]
MWDKEDFYEFILRNNVIGFFKEAIKIKSGRLSHWYINWRNIAEDVFLLDALTNYVIDFILNLGLKPECFYGVPEGATKLGIITQFKWAKKQHDYAQYAYTLSMGRGKPKDHGELKDKFFLGIPKGHVVILEDTTTTGGSLIETIDQLLGLNVKIDAAIGLSNRNELRDDGKSVMEAVKEKGIN